MYLLPQRFSCMRQSGRGIEMKDLYLIDGYNVIFWLPEEFPRTDLESSRKKLVDLMQDYGAHNDVEVIVVFDGNSRSLKAKVETVSPFSMWCTHRRK